MTHAALDTSQSIDWVCRATWKRSAHNTLWCLIGCASGDLCTIVAFQLWAPETNPLLVMALAMINGLLASIGLETVLMLRDVTLRLAIRTALGMSLVSMISMELAMNTTDYLLVGEVAVTWWSLGPTLAAGFLVPWPYNYWRLKRYGRSCH